MDELKAMHKFRIGQAAPSDTDLWGSNVASGEMVLAVAIKMTNGCVNYFLTVGKPLHRKPLWEIAKWVLEHSGAYALDGVPEEAEICYSLSDAASEPYFYEQYLEIIRTISTMFNADEYEFSKELQGGKYLYFLGSAKSRHKSRKAYWSMKAHPIQQTAEMPD
jgi:hypothetical protein